MRRMPGLALTGMVTGALLIAAPVQAAEDVSAFTLDNGLQVVVIEDHRAPVVVQMIWYKVGAADEPVGKSGIAHFSGTSDVQGHR